MHVGLTAVLARKGSYNNLLGTSEKIGSDLLKVINNVNIKTCRTKTLLPLKKKKCPTHFILCIILINWKLFYIVIIR